MSNNAQSTRIHASRTATGWKTKSRSSPAEGRARAFAREAAKVILMVRQEDKGGRSKRRSVMTAEKPHLSAATSLTKPLSLQRLIKQPPPMLRSMFFSTIPVEEARFITSEMTNVYGGCAVKI